MASAPQKDASAEANGSQSGSPCVTIEAPSLPPSVPTGTQFPSNPSGFVFPSNSRGAPVQLPAGAEPQELLGLALRLRDKFINDPVTAGNPEDYRGPCAFQFAKGMAVVTPAVGGKPIEAAHGLAEFYEDMDRVNRIRSAAPVGSYCFQRLRLLESKYDLHTMLNFRSEMAEMAANPHRDFYNVRKVDTHVHHSAAMNGKHLLRFMKSKLKKSPAEVVMTRDGQPVTLKQVFDEVGVTAYSLSLDKLNVVADQTTMCRFDNFNNKYNPMGEPLLRTIFLKTDNEMGGQYLAEITQELFDDLEEAKYQLTEYRLSIYGRKPQEWSKLAHWVLDHKLLSKQNMWMIQIPRLYSIYKRNGILENFEDMLKSIFEPLFEVTLDPESDPTLHEFLKNLSGFDTVDDESVSPVPNDRTFSSRKLTPDKWVLADNPSYKYYCFYIATNIRILNALRRARGLTTFSFRPHSGEAGELHHLDTSFLLADSINHGINLRKTPSLQYLYYLAQIGLAMSPCSNNMLFLEYGKNPFPKFFQRGLNVSLSTDDPLMFHNTKEPLLEEFSIANKIYGLHAADLCEIARNSVVQSGFPELVKRKWLGSHDYVSHNNVDATNVPQIRFDFRRKTLAGELALLGVQLADWQGTMDTSEFAMSPLVPGHSSPVYNIDPYPQESAAKEPDSEEEADLDPTRERANSNLDEGAVAQAVHKVVAEVQSQRSPKQRHSVPPNMPSMMLPGSAYDTPPRSRVGSTRRVLPAVTAGGGPAAEPPRGGRPPRNPLATMVIGALLGVVGQRALGALMAASRRGDARPGQLLGVAVAFLLGVLAPRAGRQLML